MVRLGCSTAGFTGKDWGEYDVPSRQYLNIKFAASQYGYVFSSYLCELDFSSENELI